LAARNSRIAELLNCIRHIFWSIYCILSRKRMPAGRHESLNVSVPYVGFLASLAKADQKALGLQIQKGKWYP
jgi:hypothetical protein